MKQASSRKKEINYLLNECMKDNIPPKKLLSKIFLKFNEAEMESVLTSLFTKKEIETFANRLLIVKLLKENIFQHEISRKLKVGITTVTRGANAIESGKFDFI